MMRCGVGPIRWRRILQVWLIIIWIPLLYETIAYHVGFLFRSGAFNATLLAIVLGYIPASLVLPMAIHQLGRRSRRGPELAVAGLLLVSMALVTELLRGLHHAFLLHQQGEPISCIEMIDFVAHFLPRLGLYAIPVPWIIRNALAPSEPT